MEIKIGQVYHLKYPIYEQDTTNMLIDAGSDILVEDCHGDEFVVCSIPDKGIHATVRQVYLRDAVGFMD